MPMGRLLLLLLLALPWTANAQATKTLDSLRVLVYALQDTTTTQPGQLTTLTAFLAQAQKARHPADILLAYQQLAVLNYRLGNLNEALRYYKLYTLELETGNRTTQLRQHQFEKSLYENELRALQEKALLLEKENTELKTWQEEYRQATHWISLGLKVITVIFLLLFVPWLYQRLKKSRQQPAAPATEAPAGPDLTEVLATTRNQLVTLETELDLADILAGQVIPRPEKVFAGNFSLAQKFLIHQPKKLASGDGLYMAAVQDKTIVAVFDTPGHGATGALLCGHIYRQLEDMVKNQSVVSPALLLAPLGTSLQKVFPAGVPFAKGLGMGICLIDVKARKLTYAGAQMALFMAYKGVVHKTPGTRAGLLQEDTPATYENTELALTMGMNFYLSTDGFWHQTGGSQQQPFGEGAFVKTLESLSLQPLAEHERVLKKILADWQGGNEQDDDILMVGFSPDYSYRSKAANK